MSPIPGKMGHNKHRFDDGVPFLKRAYCYKCELQKCKAGFIHMYEHILNPKEVNYETTPC